jgi:hypothetical protein
MPEVGYIHVCRISSDRSKPVIFSGYFYEFARNININKYRRQNNIIDTDNIEGDERDVTLTLKKEDFPTLDVGCFIKTN